MAPPVEKPVAHFEQSVAVATLEVQAAENVSAPQAVHVVPSP